MSLRLPPSIASDAATRRASRRAERSAALTVVALAVLLLPQVVYEPCFSDHGELQLCSAVAGIAHPAGHAGLCLLGWLLTRVPGISPSAVISLATALAGLFCLWLLMLVMLESGASGLPAAVAVISLAIAPPFWRAMIAPEVYAPCLALLALVGLLIRNGSRRPSIWLHLPAAAAFGLAVGTRPPLALYAPGYLLLWWWTRPSAARPRVAHATAAGAAFLVGVLLCLAYLWVRDTSGNPYNYIARHPAMEQTYDIPGGEGGSVRVRAGRIWWLISARQFAANLAPTPASIAAQARWLWMQLDGQYPLVFGAYALVMAIGAAAFARRTWRGGVVLLFWAIAAAASLLLIRQQGDAAMTLPLSCLLAFLGAHGMTALMSLRPRVPIAVALITLHIVCRWWTADERYLARSTDVGAAAFLREHRPAELPPRSVVLSYWSQTAPLLYDLRVTHDRPDVDVIDVSYRDWRETVRRAGDRPVWAPAGVRPPEALIAARQGPWIQVQLPAEMK